MPMLQDELWVTALAGAAVVLLLLLLWLVRKPRRFRPRDENYWRQQAQRMQKRYAGRVIGAERPAPRNRQAAAARRPQ